MKKLVILVLRTYINVVNLLLPKIGGKHAFWLFCFPFKTKLNPNQQAYLDTAEQSKLSIDGKKVPVYKWGIGSRKIVFVHGWQSNAFRWRRYIDRIDKDEFSIYAFDAPGHGNAQSIFGNVPLFAKALKELLEKIDGTETIIGHSIGSFASIYLFHTHPQLQPLKFISLAAPGNAEDFVQVYKNTLSMSNKAERNMHKYFITYTNHPVAYYDVQNFAQSIKSQGLIVHDEEDRVTDVKYASQIHRLWPNADIRITTGLGHRLADANLVKDIVSYIQEQTLEGV